MINFSEVLWNPGAPANRSMTPRIPESITLPELSRVPVVTARLTPESRLAVVTEPEGATADRFRVLRTHLRELRSTVSVRVILVTSPLPGDGKSTVALNIAGLLGENGKKDVLLLEADLHHPSQSRTLGIERTPGVAECLEDGLDPLSILRRIDPFGIYLAQSGFIRSSSPSELLQQNQVESLIRDFSKYFEWIVIDTPPVTVLTDALSLSKHADTSLLVVRAGRTPRSTIDESLRLLGPKQVLGILLNGEEGLQKKYSRYAKYYRPKKDSF